MSIPSSSDMDTFEQLCFEDALSEPSSDLPEYTLDEIRTLHRYDIADLKDAVKVIRRMELMRSMQDDHFDNLRKMVNRFCELQREQIRMLTAQGLTSEQVAVVDEMTVSSEALLMTVDLMIALRMI